MQTISLCMIVKNEEDVLERCLSGASPLADEIIIVDTGSTDRTKEIAARFTDHVYDYPWQDDFAAARNFAFSKAACDYQLWLDADDVIPPDSLQKLLTLKAELSPDTDVVMLPYHIAFDENGAPTFAYERERLLRREKRFRWTGAVHEVVTPSGNILHYDAPIEHRKLRVADPERNLRIFERLQNEGHPLDTRQKFYYARELYYHERYADALSVYADFFAQSDAWIEDRITACLHRAECLLALGREGDALRSLSESFVYAAPRAEICCAIGHIFMKQEQYARAAFWYETALRTEFSAETSGFSQPDCHDFIPLMQLCVCHDRMGNLRLASAYNEKAGRIKPCHHNVAQNRMYFRKRLALEDLQ